MIYSITFNPYCTRAANLNFTLNRVQLYLFHERFKFRFNLQTHYIYGKESVHLHVTGDKNGRKRQTHNHI